MHELFFGFLNKFVRDNHEAALPGVYLPVYWFAWSMDGSDRYFLPRGKALSRTTRLPRQAQSMRVACSGSNNYAAALAIGVKALRRLFVTGYSAHDGIEGNRKSVSCVLIKTADPCRFTLVALLPIALQTEREQRYCPGLSGHQRQITVVRTFHRTRISRSRA